MNGKKIIRALSDIKCRPESYLNRVYLFLMLALLPLFVRNGFFDITEAKTIFFVIPSIAYILARLAFALYRENGLHFRRLTAAECAAVVLSLICLGSSVLNGNFAASFLGARGRYQGAGMFWLYSALFFTFRGVRISRTELLLPLGIGLFLSSVLAVCNHLGIDPLGLYSKLAEADRGRYISTLGNINFAGAYICLILPVASAALLTTERAGERLALSALCIAGLWAAMAVRSESTVLGLGAAFFLLPLFAKKYPKIQRRYPLFLACTAFFAFVYRIIVYSYGRELSSLAELLTHNGVLLPLGCIGLAIHCFLRRKSDKTVFLVWKVYTIALLTAVIAGVAVLLLLNTVYSAVPLGGMEEWLYFSDSWGTDRGKVWKYCAVLYAGFPLWKKLVGGGCGVLAALDVQHRIFPDAVLDAAHCEYLQILLNWGVTGLGAYIVWLASELRCALRHTSETSFMLAAGLAAYAVQASVNIAQAPGICLFFLLLAVLHGQTAESPDAGDSSLRKAEDCVADCHIE